MIPSLPQSSGADPGAAGDPAHQVFVSSIAMKYPKYAGTILMRVRDSGRRRVAQIIWPQDMRDRNRLPDPVPHGVEP